MRYIYYQNSFSYQILLNRSNIKRKSLYTYNIFVRYLYNKMDRSVCKDTTPRAKMDIRYLLRQTKKNISYARHKVIV